MNMYSHYYHGAIYFKFRYPWHKYQIWLQYSSNNIKSTLYQRSTYLMGLKVVNSLPAYIKGIPCNVKKFKCIFKKLLSNSFCTFEEYFQYNNI